MANVIDAVLALRGGLTNDREAESGHAGRVGNRLDEREARLVFHLAAEDGPRRVAPRIEPPMQWGRLLAIAQYENAVASLRECVSQASPSLVPAGTHMALACHALASERRMRRLEQRLEQSLHALNSAGIDVILLKGAALAATVYGSFATRPMKDIDLLIDPSRAIEAREIMCRIGWVDASPVTRNQVYEAHHHLRPVYDRDDGSIRLEIHTALVPPGNPFVHSLGELRAAARPTMVGSSRALVMEPNVHAVYAAVHFAWSHEMQVGGWHTFRDLGALLGGGLIDWPKFVQIATHWRARTCCYWTLRLARSLAALRVPDEVLSALQPRLPEVLRRRLARHFTNLVLRSDCSCPSIRLTRALWSLAIQPFSHDHGAVRPWLVPSELMVDASRDTNAGGRVWQHMADARRWIRFLANVGWGTE